MANINNNNNDATTARDLVAEPQSQRDRAMEKAITNAGQERFAARRMPAALPCKRNQAETNIETAIYGTAANFPLTKVILPSSISTFVPCMATLMYYLNYMDHLMASTKRWTDNCMGWVPPYSQIYVSLLFYIQVMRAMECAGALRIGSEIVTLLRDILTYFPLENLWVPGPLVPFFNNLACYWSSRFGTVTPSLPDTPSWTREHKYGFGNPFYTHLPNISIFISRLRSICAAATRDDLNINTTAFLFQRDVDGPQYLATLFNHPCAQDDDETMLTGSPGATFTYAGNLRLWQDAAAQLDFLGVPDNLDSNVDEVDNTWAAALRINDSCQWIGHLATMMAKYCRFWKGSCPLSDCSPNSSAAGAVRCIASGNSTLFDLPQWVEQTGLHNSNQHGNRDQVGHYTMRSNVSLTFKASTTIEDIPDENIYSALTYQFCLSTSNLALLGYTSGQFWTIHPDVLTRSGIQVYQGVLPSILRSYHADNPIDAERQ